MIEILIKNEQEMREFGERVARLVSGGSVIELVGDVGAGKTTFTKGLAAGLGVAETVSSPSFTISRMYDGGKFRLTHYDFYRLVDAGIMSFEIEESLSDPQNITVVEWAESVSNILPEDRIFIEILRDGDNGRKVKIEGVAI